jgi:acetolactate synthase-1/2/3 large subunit
MRLLGAFFRTVMLNRGDAVADWMVRHDIDHFFTVPGESFFSVIDAVDRRPEIRLVTARHEAGAAFAAEGYGKVLGRPAVAMATRGPGAANLAIGIQTAHYDSTPMLALVATASRHLDGAGAFQAFEPSQLFGSIAKDVQSVRSRDSLVGHLEQAHFAATAGRPGPVVVAIASDILAAEVPEDDVGRREVRSPNVLPPPLSRPLRRHRTKFGSRLS